MKTIGVFVKNLTSGGAEKQSVLLARTLAHDVEVHYIVFNADKIHEKYLDMLKQEPNVRIAMFKGGHLSRFKQLVNYVRKNKIECLFSYLAAANLYACIVRMLTGVNVYTGLRNVDLPKRKRMTERILTNWCATGTIANCFTGKENFVGHGFDVDKITVIPNGFENIREYTPRAEKDELHVITVGRFHPQKDYETAVKSFALLCKQISNVYYDVVGYGDEEENIRRWVKEYSVEDKVKFYINPNNIPELLDKADIYLSTSLVEGTSNSIMEAMNADLPVVATNVGDNKYLVHDKENGFILPIGDADGIAETMKTLSESKELRLNMGKKGKELLKTNYSLEAFRNNYLRIVKE